MVLSTIVTVVSAAANHPYIATYLLLSVINPMATLALTLRNMVRVVWK